MGLPKVAKAASFKEQIYQKLKTAIINQVLQPGEQIHERMLAESLGISRTPLREALHRLESEGWIVTEAWKGTYVSPITEQDIKDIFQLREMLEIKVIELIVQQITSEQLRKLDEFHQMQIRLDDKCKVGEFIEIDRKFHMYLAELTGNKRLVQILDNLSDMIRRLGVASIHTNERYREILQEHTNIINSLKTNDPIKAKEGMLDHVLKTGNTIYRLWIDRHKSGLENV